MNAFVDEDKLRAEVSNSYTTGNVTGSEGVGGLVGMNGFEEEDLQGGNIEKSYATGNVTGKSVVGGLVGFNDDGTVEYSYWDIETTGQEEGIGNEEDPDRINGLETDQMTGEDAKGYMDVLDFENVWETIENDYPELQVFKD